MTSSGSVGSRATNVSYRKNETMSAAPRMSGVRTCTLIHGYVMPPHVSAMSASVVPATIIAFPLRSVVESAEN